MTKMRGFILTTLLLLLQSMPSDNQLVWFELNVSSRPSSDGAPSPRRYAAMAYHHTNNILLLYGGQDRLGRALQDTWMYNMDQSTWSLIRSDSNPGPRWGTVCGVLGDLILVGFGARQGKNRGDIEVYRDLWKFHVISEKWSQIILTADNDEDDAYLGRVYAVGGVYSGGDFNGQGVYFYAAQGFLGPSNPGPTSSVVRVDIDSGRWTLVYPNKHPYSPEYPHGRYHHQGSLMSPQTMLIHGGCLSGGSQGGPCPSSDTWIYSDTSKSWQQINHGACQSLALTSSSLSLLPVAGSYGFQTGSQGLERKVLMYGGTSLWNDRDIIKGRVLDRWEVAIFDVDKQQWSIRRTTLTAHWDGAVAFKGSLDPPRLREGHSSTNTHHGIVIFGGQEVGGTREMLNDLWLLVGNSSSVDQAEIVDKCIDFTPHLDLARLHGIVMVLTWGLIIPAGGMVARYAKHADPLWFHLHRCLQLLGVVLTVCGAALAFSSVNLTQHLGYIHGVLGFIILLLLIQQPILACIFRPRDGDAAVDSLRRRRRVWRVAHLILGRVTILASWVNISLGLFAAVAHYYLWCSWYGYLGLLLILIACLEVRLQWRTGHSYQRVHHHHRQQDHQLHPNSHPDSDGTEMVKMTSYKE